MEFSSSRIGKIVILHLSGNFIGEQDGGPMMMKVDEFMVEENPRFVLDLTGLRHCNSTGLGAMITVLSKARKAGGDVFLANPSAYIGNLLLITKLNTIFRVFNSVEEAAQALEA
ncbi:MAG: STAS domain-containing protein [Bacteroidia bacterium]|nr:STAS domain-containing protein [Bacteroidia bacterium]